MKYIKISSLIVLSTSSFSFRPMEGVYNHNGEKNYPVVLPDIIEYRDHNPITYFLYDEKTSVRIQCSFKNKKKAVGLFSYYPYGFAPDASREKNLITPINFFNCDFTYDKTFWNRLSSKWGLTPIDPADYSQIPPSPYLFSLIKQEQNSTKKIYKTKLYLQPQIRSRSGIEIDNTGEQVILKLGAKKITLKDALQRYFKRSSTHATLADNYAKYQKIQIDFPSQQSDNFFIEYVEPDILRLNHPLLPDENFRLLNSSEILAAWCLVPHKIGNKKVESQLIGLARNSEGKLFHWITDLEDDISALIPTSKESNLSRLINYIRSYF